MSYETSVKIERVCTKVLTELRSLKLVKWNEEGLDRPRWQLTRKEKGRRAKIAIEANKKLDKIVRKYSKQEGIKPKVIFKIIDLERL